MNRRSLEQEMFKKKWRTPERVKEILKRIKQRSEIGIRDESQPQKERMDNFYDYYRNREPGRMTPTAWFPYVRLQMCRAVFPDPLPGGRRLGFRMRYGIVGDHDVPRCAP